MSKANDTKKETTAAMAVSPSTKTKLPLRAMGAKRPNGPKPGTGAKKKKKALKRIPLSKHMKAYLGGKLSYLYDEVVRWAFSSASPLLKEREVLRRQIDVSNEKWVDLKLDNKFDSKQGVKRLADIDASLASVRQTMSTMLGTNRSYSIMLPQTLDAYMVATVTTGVVSNTVTVNPSNCAEWSTLAALFDEYKQDGFDVHHRHILIQNATGFVAGGSVDTTYRVSVADPTDTTALASVNQGLQHGVREFLPLHFNGLTTNVPLHSWSVRLPRGTMYSNSQTLFTAQDEWLPVVNLIGYCIIKHYCTQGIVVAGNVESAVIWHNLHFRLRE